MYSATNDLDKSDHGCGRFKLSQFITHLDKNKPKNLNRLTYIAKRGAIKYSP